MSKGPTPFYPDRVEGGHFVTRPVLQLLRSLEGQQVEVCIRKKRSYTTNPQRGYYFGVVIHLVAEEMRNRGAQSPYTGRGPITDIEVHEMMAQAFLRRSVCIDTDSGEYLEYIMSTSKLTTSEMSDYIEQIKQWAMETFGLDIPEANKQITFT
jgi:hypothetical protein